MPLQLGPQAGELGFGGLPGLGLAIGTLLGGLPGRRELARIQQPLAGSGIGHLKTSVLSDPEEEAGGFRQQATLAVRLDLPVASVEAQAVAGPLADRESRNLIVLDDQVLRNAGALVDLLLLY